MVAPDSSDRLAIPWAYSLASCSSVDPMMLVPACHRQLPNCEYGLFNSASDARRAIRSIPGSALGRSGCQVFDHVLDLPRRQRIQE